MFHPLSRIGFVGGTITPTWTSGNSVLSAYDANLVAYWDFQEQYGGRRDHVKGYGALITQNDGYRDGKYGKEVLWADSNSPQLSVAHSAIDLAAWSAAAAKTMAFWFKAINENGNRDFVNFDDGSGLIIRYEKNSSADGPRKIKVRGYSGGSTVTTINSASNWDDGNWHHLCLRAPANPLVNWSNLYLIPTVVADPADATIPTIAPNADGAGMDVTLGSAYTDTVDVSFMIRRPNVDANRGPYLDLYDSSARMITEIYGGYLNGELVCSGYFTPMITMSANVWYTVRIYDVDFTAHTFKCSVDGTPKGTFNFVNASANNVKKITLRQNNAGGQFYTKEISLSSGGDRKFTDGLVHNAWRLYVDGAFEGLGGAATGDTGQPSRFGYATGQAPLASGNGFDELGLWNTNISDGAIAALAAGAYHIAPTGTWTANNAVMSPRNANLVAYWTLDEVSGDRIDKIGSYTATDTNTVTSGAGVHGKGALFNHSNSEYLTCAHATVDLAAVFATEVFSISFWFTLVDEAVDKGFFGVSDTSNGVQSWYRRSNEGTNPHHIQVRAYNAAGTTASFVSTNHWDDGAWHHFCLVANGSGATDWTLYIDGASEGTGGGLVGDGGGAFRIGADFNTYYNSDMMDEVGVFNCALSAGEVTALFNGSFYK